MNAGIKRVVCLVALLVLMANVAIAQQLKIHHIDVGQGDATLIVSPTGGTMLIDAGDNGKGTSDVLPYLNSLGVTSLTYVTATHYHSDHIGGLDEVLNSIGSSYFGTVFDRGTSPAPPSTTVYTNYSSAASGHRAVPSLGQIIDLGGGVTLKCIAEDGNVINYGAVSNASSSENDLCVAWLLTYGGFKYYTGGDCGGESSAYADLETPMAPAIGVVDAMKVNHHGSQYSTNQTFVNTLTPTAAVISVGDGNSYGHPVQSTLTRLANAGCKIYQTETGSGGTIPSGAGWVANGDVVLTTTGTGTFSMQFGSTVHTYNLHSGGGGGGGPIDYFPTATHLFSGSVSGGSFSDLASDNGVYFKVASTTSSTRTADWYASTTIPGSPSSVTGLAVTYNGKYSASRTQKLYLYNNYYGRWDQIDSRSVGTSDVTVTYTVPSYPSDYVAANGEIDLRVTASSTSSSFTAYGDLAKFTVTTQ